MKIRMRLIQNPTELFMEYAHRLDYNHKDFLFLQYVRSRTGVVVATTDPDIDPEEQHQEQWKIYLQCMLQDVWEMYKQPGVKEKFAMEYMIKEATRNE